jgi:y4mF family transcriptional regulator
MPRRPPKAPTTDRLAPLAAAVRRRRRAHGLTQVELGRFAGCGPDFVYDLESGKPTIRIDKLLDVLLVLGLELRLVDGKSGLSIDEALAGDAAP